MDVWREFAMALNLELSIKTKFDNPLRPLKVVQSQRLLIWSDDALRFSRRVLRSHSLVNWSDCDVASNWKGYVI